MSSNGQIVAAFVIMAAAGVGGFFLLRYLGDKRKDETAAESSAAVDDSTATSVGSIRNIPREMSREWESYKSTDWSDALKRNNIRGKILLLGSELVGKLEEAGPSTAGRAILSLAIKQSAARLRCYEDRDSPCGRWAENEPSRDEKARDETALRGKLDDLSSRWRR